MARKTIKFKARVTISGSHGIALYIPSHIVKATALKSRKNESIPCILDEDGDIIVLMDDVEEDAEDEK